MESEQLANAKEIVGKQIKYIKSLVGAPYEYCIVVGTSVRAALPETPNESSYLPTMESKKNTLVILIGNERKEILFNKDAQKRFGEIKVGQTIKFLNDQGEILLMEACDPINFGPSFTLLSVSDDKLTATIQAEGVESVISTGLFISTLEKGSKVILDASSSICIKRFRKRR